MAAIPSDMDLIWLSSSALVAMMLLSKGGPDDAPEGHARCK
jgi:hypothetical protein